MSIHIAMLSAWLLTVASTPKLLHAQEPQRTQLDSLIVHAVSLQPSLTAAMRRADALRLRAGPAGTLPDPMLGIGIMNMPVREPGFKDEMTMATVTVSQTVPSSKRLDYERAAMEAEAAAAEASLATHQLELRADVGEAYYELVFNERSLEVLRRTQTLLAGVHATAESRYAAGLGTQHDVIRTRLDLSALAEKAVVLEEGRRARLSQLNALLYRAPDFPVHAPAVSDSVVRLAVASDASQISFASSALGARVANTPIPQVASLQLRAVERNPELRRMNAMVAATRAREQVAARGASPDIEVALQYGARPGMSDMLSLMVSAPIPIRRKRNQDLLAVAAANDVAAVSAERDAMVATVRAEVAELHALIEQIRSQLALYRKAILPQGSAAVQSALAAFSAGKSDLGSVLDAASALLAYEESFHRLLSDFATRLLQLEAVIGGQVMS